MAVLKYRASDGTIKTLEIKQSVASGGVVSVNGKTGVVTGLYDSDNPPPYPVRSVNGKTGDVTGLYDEENQPPYPVTSVNGKTGAVTGLYDAENPPQYPVTSVNGREGAVTGLYDAENPPPYPVSSVNGKTGAVTGIYDANNPPPYPVTSVNGKTGNITGLYNSDNPPPYPVTSVNGKTGAVTISEIKVARVTTEVYGEGSRHRFLKSSLPGLNSSLTAPEAILNVVNASSVPMIPSRFEYDGNYVTISLLLLDASPVTNSQTLTIFYR